MKRLALLLASFVLIATPAVAATATPSSKLDELKERLATKVAQLKTTEKWAIFGSVKSKTLTALVVETKTKDVKIELTDEVKVIQYLKGKRTTLTVDEVTKGDLVTVYGDYDTTLDLLKATIIIIQTVPPLRLSGTVADVDRKDFSLKLAAGDGQTYTVDIEPATRVTRWDKTNKFTKSGFSKMAIGDTIHVVGTAIPKKEKRISGIRILNVGNPVGSPPPTPTPTPTPEESATPSATPKTTLKTTPKPTPTP
ncbi:hypothetical protein HY086_04270 [Candidatus Gottesmanbacteria bacterium]|nr:hypothetical protein [Candidatus Gottesmanbacteria bacterium]